MKCMSKAGFLILCTGAVKNDVCRGTGKQKSHGMCRSEAPEQRQKRQNPTLG